MGCNDIYIYKFNRKVGVPYLQECLQTFRFELGWTTSPAVGFQPKSFGFLGVPINVLFHQFYEILKQRFVWVAFRNREKG